MKLFIPNMYQSDIYNINYELMRQKKIKCLLFDLDNTCVSYYDKEVPQKLRDLFDNLTKMGFKVILFSNSSAKRLANFSTLRIVLHPSSRKPLKKNFNKILKKYHYTKNDVCIIGDQLLTDILGGNRVGINTCLVEPLTNKELIFTKFSRQIEKLIFKKLEKNGNLTKGEYYE